MLKELDTLASQLRHQSNDLERVGVQLSDLLNLQQAHLNAESLRHMAPELHRAMGNALRHMGKLQRQQKELTQQAEQSQRSLQGLINQAQYARAAHQSLSTALQQQLTERLQSQICIGLAQIQPQQLQLQAIARRLILLRTHAQRLGLPGNTAVIQCIDGLEEAVGILGLSGLGVHNSLLNISSAQTHRQSEGSILARRLTAWSQESRTLNEIERELINLEAGCEQLETALGQFGDAHQAIRQTQRFTEFVESAWLQIEPVFKMRTAQIHSPQQQAFLRKAHQIQTFARNLAQTHRALLNANQALLAHLNSVHFELGQPVGTSPITPSQMHRLLQQSRIQAATYESLFGTSNREDARSPRRS